MGYSLTLEAVVRVQKFRQTLKDSKEDEVTWQTIEPKKFQYYLHTGLIAAEHIEHPEFKELRAEWRIKMRGANIIATRKMIGMMGVGGYDDRYPALRALPDDRG